ncbi:MAG: flavodoxin family protein [Peptococcaceae bacterium]|nr:flavodoxin family protein [Peptococcaceae bacterium]
MKIIIINGSPRSNGATGQVLSKISETIGKMDSNIEIESIDLAKLNLLFCTGCAACYKTGRCHIQEDGIEDLSRKIEECDGVILGSPTYASNVSAQFKILIDRGHFIFEQLLKNKACFSVVTYANYGGGEAQKVINNLIQRSGGAARCKYMIKINHGDTALNDQRNKHIERLCHKFVLSLNKKNPSSFYDKLVSTIAFNMVIKPYVFKNRSQYKGVISRWVEQGLIPE